MRLIDCLEQLPDDAVLRDHAAVGKEKQQVTVEDLKASPGIKNSPDNGYHVSEGGKNYGPTKVTRIVHERAGLAFTVISGKEETH